jgi:hypothetical protein
MELVGASYLYALSTISMTFVGYARLLLALRETPGHAISSYDTYFTLSFMQAGFIVTAGGLMPQLLAFCQLPLPWVWRLSSAAISIPIALFVTVTPRRRRRAVQEPVPFFIRILLGLQLLAALALACNAANLAGTLQLAIYALSMTMMLFTSVIAYVIALGRALRARGSPSQALKAPSSAMW